MIMTFDADHLRALLDLAHKSPILEGSYTQVASPEFWKSDMEPERLAMLTQDAAGSGVSLQATPADVDPEKLVPGLFLVGDEGVYMMANIAMEKVQAAGVSHVAYARETDPKLVTRDTMHSRKSAGFGGDDGVEFIPAAALEGLLPEGGVLRIEITPDQIAIMVPDNTLSERMPEPGVD